MISSDIYNNYAKDDLAHEKDLIQKKDDNNNTKNLTIASTSIGTDYTYKHTYVLTNIIIVIVLNTFALWGVGIMITGNLKIETYLWSMYIKLRYFLNSQFI